MRTFRLGKGAHKTGPEGGVGCVNEIASQLAGLSWGDAPPCVDPVIQRLSIWYNDNAANDEELNADGWATLLPWRLVGTKATPEIEQRRAYMAADCAVRFVAPLLLRRAGLVKYAQSLESLPEIDSENAARAADAAADADLQTIRDSLRGLIDRMIALTEPVEAVCEVKLAGCGK